MFQIYLAECFALRMIYNLCKISKYYATIIMSGFHFMRL